MGTKTLSLRVSLLYFSGGGEKMSEKKKTGKPEKSRVEMRYLWHHCLFCTRYGLPLKGVALGGFKSPRKQYYLLFSQIKVI